MYNEIIHNRTDALRNSMKLRNIDFYLITTADYHSSEYVSDFFKCREYFSGFSGSNGDLLVWQDGAALWTDGRYFIQAASELEGTGISLMKMGEKGVPTLIDFLRDKMLPGESLGFDGRCIPLSLGSRLESVMREVDKKACADAENPNMCRLIWDADLAEDIWNDRPCLPSNEAWLMSEKITGESRSSRIEAVRSDLKKNGCKALVISSLDDIAWLLLLRGGDIAYNPVALSYLVLYEEKAVLYINPDIVSKEICASLEADGVFIKPYNDIYDDLKCMNASDICGGKIFVDPDRLSYALYKCVSSNLEDSQIFKSACPTIIRKACKTDAEQEGEKIAHIKDGVAVTKFLFYLDKLKKSQEFKSGKCSLTELDLADILLQYRKEQKDFLDQSFAPIIATGEHGAIIHYEPDEKTNAVIKKDAFLLMDTGAQFLQGTTDITRTVVMGEATEEMKLHYTAVLRGNLNLCDAVFPEGTTGVNLDILARKPLWDLGLNYNHGTGHGVGFVLNVHEGPQNISKSGRGGTMGTAFKPGMITSDEPGLYLEGKYGIRTENMMVCVRRYSSEFGEYYGFEPLTMVPFDRDSIAPELMSIHENKLLNDYHKKVYESISMYLNEEERNWLKEVTAPL